MLEAFGSGSYVWGQGWGPGVQAEMGGGGRLWPGPVTLGSNTNRGPLWAKVELSLLGSDARTSSSQACAVLEYRDPTARRTVGSG